MSIVRANNKFELIDETRFVLKKSLGITVPSGLVTSVINRRSEKIRIGIEEKCPRILIEGIGSFRIKQGKKQSDGNPRKGREYYVKKAHKDNLTNMSVKFVTKFKIVSDGV